MSLTDLLKGAGRGARNLGFAVGLASLLAVGAGRVRAKEEFRRRHAEYGYVVETQKTDIRSSSKARKRLLYRSEGTSGISSVGNYSTEEEVNLGNMSLDTALKFETEVEVGENDVTFEYSVTPYESRDELPAENRFGVENPATTHIYFLMPKGVKIKGALQAVHGYVHAREKEELFVAVPANDSDVGKFFEKINKTIFAGDKISESDINIFEEMMNNILENLPGRTGRVIEVGTRAVGYGLRKLEEKRIKDLEERFPEMQIVPMPFNQVNGNPLGRTDFGRKTMVSFYVGDIRDNPDAEDFHGEGRVVVYSLSFSIDMGGGMRAATLDGVEYKFAIGNVHED